MNIYERIKQLGEQQGKSIYRIEKDCGLSNGSIMKWGKSTPNAESAQKVADYLNVDINYLLGRTDSPAPENNNPTRPSYEYYPTEGVVSLKIIGAISAGYNGEAVEEILGEQAFLASALRGYPPEDCFLLQVKGNSMYPDYRDKDIVLVHRQTSVDSGTVAVVLYNGDEATLKKVVYKPNEDWLELIPKNPEYPTKRIEGADLQECRILGKVICIVFGERP